MSSSPEPPADDAAGGDPHDTGEAHGPVDRKGRPKPSLTRSVVEWIVVIAAALLIAFGIKTFLFQPFKIPSGSMEQTLHIGDRVLVNKLSYHLHGVHRGDVVVFKRPPNHPELDADDLIKRVIGLSGEQVTIRDNQVFINGKPLNEPYVMRVPGTGQPEPSKPQPPGCTFPHFTGVPEPPGLPPDTLVVPQGDVFVMGDNRTDSSDSRCFGPISKKLIVGRAFLRMWPPSRVALL